MNKNIFAIILLIYSVFGGGLFDLLDKNPTPEPVVEILNINKPSDEVIARVKVFSDIVSDPTDRSKLAIFNYEFAKRVVGYETTVQQVNDVYSLAGKTFFQNSIVNKYESLSENITDLLEEIITDENHVVSMEEKNKLNEYFMGVAWVLVQKG